MSTCTDTFGSINLEFFSVALDMAYHNNRILKIINSFDRYRLLLAKDGQWGGVLPDGSITGMIGMVARHEVHFAINEITITGQLRSFREPERNP